MTVDDTTVVEYSVTPDVIGYLSIANQPYKSIESLIKYSLTKCSSLKAQFELVLSMRKLQIQVTHVTDENCSPHNVNRVMTY